MPTSQFQGFQNSYTGLLSVHLKQFGFSQIEYRGLNQDLIYFLLESAQQRGQDDEVSDFAGLENRDVWSLSEWLIDESLHALRVPANSRSRKNISPRTSRKRCDPRHHPDRSERDT